MELTVFKTRELVVGSVEGKSEWWAGGLLRVMPFSRWGMGPSAPVKGLALMGAWTVSSVIGETRRRVDVGASGSSGPRLSMEKGRRCWGLRDEER